MNKEIINMKEEQIPLYLVHVLMQTKYKRYE